MRITEINDNELVAKTHAGFEKIMALELENLGATNVKALSRAVSFNGNLKTLYSANYQTRTALRILKPIYEFIINNEKDYYNGVKAIKWENYFTKTQTFSVDSTINNTLFNNSHFVSLRAKDAIVDRFREKTGGRPSVEVKNPNIRVNIYINNNNVIVSLDSSGDSLHKRGYHVSNAEAPLSETLAAGMILLSEWDKKSHFIDPMCGSGTLLCEAALIAMNIPVGTYRNNYSFMYWNDFDNSVFENVKNEAFNQQCDFDFEIIGSDISSKNLNSAIANVKTAKLHKDISLKVARFQDIIPPKAPGILITNPPYGERIKIDDLKLLYSDLGAALKKNFSDYKAWIITSTKESINNIHLKPMKKYQLFNGQLKCLYSGFDLYKGSLKVKKIL